MLETCQRLDEKHALAFLADGLAPELRHSFENHIDECEACRITLAALIRSDKTSPAWTPGCKVGRYVIGERLGRGAMGSVYQARDPELGRAVAIKRLHANVNDDGRARLIAEARVAAQLQHANVVTVHEVGDADGVPFIAMELIEGTTLKAWLQSEPRSWRDVVAVLAQAGRGLAAAHARGLVHRDFKPDNILVDTSGRARVADFGLARSAQDGDPGLAEVFGSSDLAQTATGSLAGTPAYLAPEIVNGAQPDARSDQYAYAITLFEALYGQHPFAGETATAMWSEMAEGRIRDGGRSVPAWLARHVRRALAVDPADRWPDVATLAAAIERRPRWRWAVAVAAGALVVAGISAAAARSIETVDPCASGAQLVGTVWNAGIRDAQAARLSSVAAHRGGAIATAGTLLDDWAAAWRFGRSSACSAAPEQRERRISCLDRQLADLRAQLAVWKTADVTTVDNLVTASLALPRPDDCAIRQPPPTTAAPALLDRIAELNALWRAGRERVAQSKLSAVLKDVEASGDLVAGAAAHTIAGGIEIALGDKDKARAHEARAVQEAATSGDDATVVDAILLEAEVASAQGRPLEALGLCEAADAIRIRNKLDCEDRIALIRGEAFTAQGRFPDAIGALRRAVAVLEPRAEHERRARLELASALGSLGSALGQEDQIDEAVRVLLRGLAIEEADLGPDHPRVGKTLHSLANREVSLGRLDDARQHFERARTIFSAAYGSTNELVCRTDIGLADLETQREHHDDARRYLMRAQADLASPPDDIASGIEYRLGWADCEQHRPADGVAHFDRAIAIFDRTGQTGENLARNLSARAKCLGDLRRDAEARRDITRAIAELDAAHSDLVSYTEMWDVLADIEWRAGHKARAIELARRIVKALSDQTFPEAVTARKDEEAKLTTWTKS